MTVAATQTLNGVFRVRENTDGTVTLQEYISSSWTTPSGGPYTQAQLLQLWQDLANVGFGPR